MKGFLAVLRTIAESLLDAILPLRARAARTKERTIEDIPLSPKTHDLLGVRITTLAEYQDQAVLDLIQSLKYDGSRYAAHLCAGVLAEYLLEEIASQKIYSQKKIYVVPVPLHGSRMRERGYNQIEIVLRALPEEYRDGTLSYMEAGVLKRIRETKAQTRLSRSERLSNVAGAFELGEKMDLKHARIFLIDDVTTTGATLANAATPLRRAGAEVSLIALARA